VSKEEWNLTDKSRFIGRGHGPSLVKGARKGGNRTRLNDMVKSNGMVGAGSCQGNSDTFLKNRASLPFLKIGR
jgi:hypothetical protein